MKPARFLAIIAALLLFAGCAEQIGEIDRTQANALTKSDFYGVWYRMAVVTDIPASAGFGFVGQTNFGGTGGKVMFDIQENQLVVFPVTETVRDGDKQWHRRKFRTYWIEGHEDEFIELLAGNPVAVYPITAHFDIQRDYSPSTGAQSNVIVENTTDRPWWKRKYMRVNWMANQFTEILFPQGSMSYSPVDYYPQEHEQENPNRFLMEDGYFHFTRRLFGQPMSTGSCSTYSLAAGDCSGAAFDVRISFRRADPKVVNDFEIRNYHNEPDAERFGFFLSERHTYDPEYGLTYRGQDYKAQIWNLWQKSVELQPLVGENGKDIACKSNADCEAPAVCDQPDWFVAGRCAVKKSVPYRERGLKPIIYHISAGHPKNSLPAIYKVADNWSDVFKETVSWLFFWEETWAQDKVSGFQSAGDLFGQRKCASNADCTHESVLSSGEASYSDNFNTLVIGTKAGNVIAYDKADKCSNAQIDAGDCAAADDRPSIDGGAYIQFINATPDSSPATLTVGSKSIAEVKFVAGPVDGHANAVVMPKTETNNRFTLTVASGSEKAELINAQINSNRVYFVVYYGGSEVALVESQLTKRGIRLLHGIKSGTAKNGNVTHATGDVAEAGINGVRSKQDLRFGELSEYIYVTDTHIAPVFIKRGSRSDVACITQSGVGQCFGWKQTITQEQRERRQAIRTNELPALFVLCENEYTGDACPADKRGKASELNDCRYWGTYGGKAGDKPINPCKEFVVKPTAPKAVGDSRYNYFYWVPNPHNSAPLGYGPSAADPDTGMLFWGTANIYGASLISYAQWGKDLVDLLNGDLDVNAVASGKYIREYLASLEKAANDSLFEGAKSEERYKQLDTGSVTDAAARARLDISTLMGAPIEAAEKELAAQEMHKAEDPKNLGERLLNEAGFFDMSEVFARLDKVRGTPLERAMINDEVALAVSGGSIQPGDAIAPEAIGEISPAGWASPRREIDEKLRMQLLGYNNIFLAEFSDPALIAMAKRLKCQDGQKPTDTYAGDSIGDKACYKGDALRLALHDALFRGVLEHEVGHTVGLRHNFSGSADALNYFDPYYDPATGREQEPVLCADIVSQFGTVSGDDICESSLGETCNAIKCSSDGDCPAGLACGSGQCVDVNGIKVGQCTGTQRQRVACTGANAESACGTDAICKDGTCQAKFACTGDTDCASGEVCAGKFCQDVRTGAFRSTPLFAEKTGIVQKFMPRTGLTKSEINNRRTELQYSTIMDYGQKINADFMGLGKYDYAAIKYGYGRMLEVFADMTYMRDQLKVYAKNTAQTEEASAWRLNTDGWKGAGAITHPFYYLNNWMPPAYLKQRDAVPGHWVQAENALEKYGRSSFDKTYFEVPYKYCSDEYRGGSLACYYFDTGAHMQEIVHHATEQMQEYYLFDAFKRERLFFGTGGNPLSYMSRVIDRYLTPIGAAARYYAVYNNIFRVYSFFPFYDNHPMYMRALRSSSEDAFRSLAALLTSPAPGSYKLDTATNTYINTSYATGEVKDSNALDIPMGTGRLPWTTFATENGYYFANHPAWIGSYWDKLAAIQIMTSSSASFLSDFVGEQLPLFRGTAIGFNTVYPKELSTILGGLAAGSLEEVGGYAVKGPDGKMAYQPRDPFAPTDKSAPRVAPSIDNLSLRLFAAWQAIANLPAGFDPSFTDSMAIWLKGDHHQYAFGSCSKFGTCDGANGAGTPVVDWAEFDDPWGKKTYVAPRVNYNKDYFSPTYYMLTRLNDLKSKWQVAQGEEKEALAAEMHKELEVVDYFRLLFKVYGSIGL